MNKLTIIFNKYLLAIFCISTFFSSFAFAQTDIQFIVDFSGSMTKKLDGEAQIDLARQALLEAIGELPAEHSASLRLYGHNISKDQKEASCKDSQQLINFGTLDVSEVKLLIENLDPKGYTPIAYSLEKAAEDLDFKSNSEEESQKSIILLTDGRETCGGDPLGVLKKLKEKGFDLTVYAIGFNVDASTRNQLKSLSEFSGGQYYDAKNAAALKDSLSEATKASLFIDKEKSVSGNVIKGGNGYEDAVQLPLNREFRLDHHQKIGDYDYFKFSAFVGDTIVVELKSQEKGLGKKDNKENNKPNGSLRLQTGDRNTLKWGGVRGQFLNKKMLEGAPYSGTYYVLVGDKDYPQHKDHISFKVSLIKKGDLDTDNDAGNTIETAMPVSKPGRYKGMVGIGGDVKDVYSLEVSAGDTYTIGVAPNSCKVNHIPAYKFHIFNEFAEKFKTKRPGSGCSGTKAKITFPESEVIYIEVARGLRGWIDYSLIIRKNSGQKTE